MRGINIIGISRAEVQEGVPVDDGSTCSSTPQPWYPTLCTLVCCSFFCFFFFFHLLSTEDGNKQEKSVSPPTKHITVCHAVSGTLCGDFPSSFVPIPKAPCSPALHLCRQAGSITASRWAQDLSVPLARRAPVCVSCQQLL